MHNGVYTKFTYSCIFINKTSIQWGRDELDLDICKILGG